MWCLRAAPQPDHQYISNNKCTKPEIIFLISEFQTLVTDAHWPWCVVQISTAVRTKRKQQVSLRFHTHEDDSDTNIFHFTSLSVGLSGLLQFITVPLLLTASLTSLTWFVTKVGFDYVLGRCSEICEYQKERNLKNIDRCGFLAAWRMIRCDCLILQTSVTSDIIYSELNLRLGQEKGIHIFSQKS